jgi:hypothetical protein
MLDATLQCVYLHASSEQPVVEEMAKTDLRIAPVMDFSCRLPAYSDNIEFRTYAIV